jgi:hypothetical protein
VTKPVQVEGPGSVRLDRGYTLAAIREHLDRQRGIPDGYVKLDTGAVVLVGGDAVDGDQ